MLNDLSTSLKKTMRNFAYFGTPSTASETLAVLIENGFLPSVVITSPDAPRGRGLVLTPSPTKSLALLHTIPVITPTRLDASAIDTICKYQCDYALVVAYGKIFPEELIATFPKGVYNVHYSLLPKYRGATPLETALLNGESVTGVTVQKMVKELDAGDIVVQEETPISPLETARELRPRLIEIGARLLLDTLPAIEDGSLTATPQDASQATRAYKIKKEDGELDLSADGTKNWHRYRAYADSIGTYFFHNGKRVKIVSAVFRDNAFILGRIIPEGKKEMSYTDFLARNS